MFAYIGAAATVAMLFLTGDRYLLGAALFLVANIAFGASVVVYNSFLPQLAGPDERDTVSSVGWAFGYLGGGTLLLLNVVAVLFKDALGMTTGEVARWSIVSAGLWWAGFTTIPLLRLRNRPPLAGEARGGRARRRVPAAVAHAALAQGVPADAVLPDRLPGLQRRHPDGDRAGRPCTAPRSWSCPTTCWCRRS